MKLINITADRVLRSNEIYYGQSIQLGKTTFMWSIFYKKPKKQNQITCIFKIKNKKQWQKSKEAKTLAQMK